ncbi:MAG: sigma-70 family RNA polymerase sigma factor [Aureliella sp.]
MHQISSELPDAAPKSETTLAALRCRPAGALAELFAKHREKLRRLVASRLDRRLARRIDASDVIQETMIEASRRLDEYLANPAIPFDRWLHILAEQNSIDAYRYHIATQKRSVRAEASLDAESDSGTSPLDEIGPRREPSPRSQLIRLENRSRVNEALSTMSQTDQDLIRMRYFDGLKPSVIGASLGITPDAASKRIVRALKRLGKAMGSYTHES